VKDRDLARLGASLRAKRDEVLSSRRAVAVEAHEAAPTAYSFHAADHAGAAYDREVGARVLEAEAELLGEIDRALGRIAEGAYGVCEACGAPIPLERLQAKPWARHCVPCRSAIEKNGRNNGRSVRRR
jgi:DnaK suppressor protein